VHASRSERGPASAMSRLIAAGDVEDLARGCALLGAGGGGDTSVGRLMMLQAIGDFGPVTLVGVDELDPDALVMPCGMVGAPTVATEKFESGDEGARLRQEVERLRGEPVACLMPAEIGGSNGLLPFVWAARLSLPVLDADGMGRAFPEIPQVAMHLAGISPSPAVMTDERGNVAVFRACSGAWLERLERATAVEFGGSAASTEYCMTAGEARRAAIHGSVTRALGIGKLRLGGEGNLVDELVIRAGGFILLFGKVADVERRTSGGFVRGSVVVEGTGSDAGRLLRLELQNENLVAFEGGELRACVPDLISVVDVETGDAISTERLRYGQRVAVLGLPCDPLWRTEGGLGLVGPRAFGYDLDYQPIEELVDADR
jgi:DUF917 family protein